MIPVPLNTFLEYPGAGPGSLGAQQIGFVVWIIGGLLLIAWGITRKPWRACSSTR
jgi:hypothetical protein